LLDMELRGYLRSLAAGERSKLVNDPDVAPEIVEAVLRAPAVLSDVGAEAWSRLQQKVRMARHGPELAKLEAEGVAIAAWREAIDLIRSDVKRAVEVAEHEATAPEKPAA
jgi:hypothetical protein